LLGKTSRRPILEPLLETRLEHAFEEACWAVAVAERLGGVRTTLIDWSVDFIAHLTD
jgi:hypothetical protein